MRKLPFLLSAVLVAFAVAALPGCSTNTQGDSASPVFLYGEFTTLPLQKLLTDATPLQFSSTTLHSVLKTTGITSLQFLDVQVDSYVVSWTRVDGGTVASASQTFGGDSTVPAGGTTTLTNYPYMTADALLRPPLDALYPFNGGIDPVTGKAEIVQAGHVIWYGHTLSGQPVTSTVATFNMIFIYGGAAAGVQGKVVR
jgi:hypothetical protein